MIRIYNIPTIESRADGYRLKLHFGRKLTLSINYLAGKYFTDMELETLDQHILLLHGDIRKLHNNTQYNSKFKDITYLHGDPKTDNRLYKIQIRLRR